MATRRMVACLAGYLVLTITVSGCSSNPTPRPPKLNCEIVSSSSLNPYEDGQSSAVVVRLYELRATGTFMNSSYLQLIENDQTLLASDLVGWSDRKVVLPNQTLEVERETLSVGTQYLGVLAEFRDYSDRSTNWRAYIETPPKKKTRCRINLDRNDLRIDKR